MGKGSNERRAWGHLVAIHKNKLLTYQNQWHGSRACSLESLVQIAPYNSVTSSSKEDYPTPWKREGFFFWKGGKGCGKGDFMPAPYPFRF